MHTTASSLVAIAQYFGRIRTSLLYGNQQKFNIEAVNDYPPIWFEIRFEQKFPIRRSLVQASPKILEAAGLQYLLARIGVLNFI